MIAVERPHALEFEDGFADDAGNPNPAMPVTTTRVSPAEPSDGGTRMSIETTFGSLDQMERLVAMGMKEGMKLAIGQIDGLLAA